MEQEMIRRLLAREEAGMADLLLHYGPLMRYIIAPILPNPQDREDCLSEVTLRVWEKIEQYDRKRGSWNAWLTAITRNTALNHARKTLGSSAEELPEDTPAAGHTPEEAVLQRERQEAVRDALERLPYRDRILFYRKYYYMQPTAQIAAFAKGHTPYPRWCWVFSPLVGGLAAQALGFLGNLPALNAIACGWLAVGCLWMFGGLLCLCGKAR